MGFYANHIFPRVMDRCMRGRKFHWERKLALAPAFGEVLEIGFGTGLNLEHYPEAVRAVTAVEPAEMLPRRVAGRVEAARMPVERVTCGAEVLPFERGRFDCAVSTWTLCTIGDPAAALREIARVLKPGGKFIFLEHGRSQNPRLARWQDRLNPLQNRFACGCNLNRRIDDLIRRGGLEIVQLDRYRLPVGPKIATEMYRGVAVSGA